MMLTKGVDMRLSVLFVYTKDYYWDKDWQCLSLLSSTGRIENFTGHLSV